MIVRTAAVLCLLATTALAQQTDVTIGMQLEPPNLDPTGGAAAAIDEVVYANVFEGLTRFGPDGRVQPALAESWNVSDDGTVWTFALHDGVTFHDGTTMDAGDVVFSLDRARAEDSTNAQKALFDGIESVEAVDPTTVRITLTAPNGNLPFNLAWGDAVIVAPESAETNATNPVGTGPFQFADWMQGDRVELVANPDYWGEKPALQSATFKFISDPNAAFAAMMAGDLDAFPNFPAPETLSSFQADPRFTVIVGSTEGETILGINNATVPDVRVRRAIGHAIDRQAVIDGAMFGFGTPIGSHFAPHNPDYVDLTGESAYDPELAESMLAEAGATDLTLRLMLPPPVYARRGGEIIASQLRAVGIETEIANLEWAQWLEQVFNGKDFDLTIVSHTEPADINIYARPDYYFQYDDAGFQDLIAMIDTTTDAERAQRASASRRSDRSPTTRSTPTCSSSPRPAWPMPGWRGSGRTRRHRPTTSPASAGPNDPRAGAGASGPCEPGAIGNDMTLRAALVLLLALTFAASPFFVDGFAGFDPAQFPVRIEEPPVQPAGYAFAIWGPIYLWLIVMAGFGVQKRRDDPRWDATRLSLIVTLGVGTFWLAVAVASPVWATVLIWIMLGGALVALLRTPAADPLLLRAPLGLYAGWLTAASCVSLGLLLPGFGIGPFGPEGWAIAALSLGLAIAVAILRALPSLAYGAAVVWALIGVLVQNGADLVGLFALGAAVTVAALTVLRFRSSRS